MTILAAAEPQTRDDAHLLAPSGPVRHTEIKSALRQDRRLIAMRPWARANAVVSRLVWTAKNVNITLNACTTLNSILHLLLVVAWQIILWEMCISQVYSTQRNHITTRPFYHIWFYAAKRPRCSKYNTYHVHCILWSLNGSIVCIYLNLL